MCGILVFFTLLVTYASFAESKVCYWSQRYETGELKWILDEDDRRLCTSYHMGGVTLAGNGNKDLSTEYASDAETTPTGDHSAINNIQGRLTNEAQAAQPTPSYGSQSNVEQRTAPDTQTEPTSVHHPMAYGTIAATTNEHHTTSDIRSEAVTHHENPETTDSCWDGTNSHPLDCYEAQQNGCANNGVYTIYPDGTDAFNVSCDMDTDGAVGRELSYQESFVDHGVQETISTEDTVPYALLIRSYDLRRWIFKQRLTAGGNSLFGVFQRREDGSVNFFRYWTDYVNGFGNISGEHWLGNDKLHYMTNQRNYSLRVDLGDFDGESRHAVYKFFVLANASDNYRLLLGPYDNDIAVSDAGDAMSVCNGQQFSARDRDNDIWLNNCADTFKGGWWYEECHRANLNGLYLAGPHSSRADGVNWYNWKGHYYSLKFSEMKIRPCTI